MRRRWRRGKRRGFLEGTKPSKGKVESVAPSFPEAAAGGAGPISTEPDRSNKFHSDKKLTTQQRRNHWSHQKPC